MKHKKVIIILTLLLCLVGAFSVGGIVTDQSNAGTEARIKQNRQNEKQADADQNKERKTVKSAKSETKNEAHNVSQKINNTSGDAKSDNKSRQTEGEARSSDSKHVHEWVPVYTYETVEDIGSTLIEVCKGCGVDITSWSQSEWLDHSYMHLEKGEPSGFYEKEVKTVTGTHQVKKLCGYRCSCGVNK